MTEYEGVLVDCFKFQHGRLWLVVSVAGIFVNAKEGHSTMFFFPFDRVGDRVQLSFHGERFGAAAHRRAVAASWECNDRATVTRQTSNEQLSKKGAMRLYAVQDQTSNPGRARMQRRHRVSRQNWIMRWYLLSWELQNISKKNETTDAHVLVPKANNHRRGRTSGVFSHVVISCGRTSCFIIFDHNNSRPFRCRIF